MMKMALLKAMIVMGLVTMSQVLWAGVTKFNSDEFNSIISENLKAEKDLRQELSSSTGLAEVEKELKPNWNERGRELIGVVEAEQMVAPTTDHHRDQAKNPADKKLQKKNLERISQEVDSLSRQ